MKLRDSRQVRNCTPRWLLNLAQLSPAVWIRKASLSVPSFSRNSDLKIWGCWNFDFCLLHALLNAVIFLSWTFWTWSIEKLKPERCTRGLKLHIVVASVEYEFLWTHAKLFLKLKSQRVAINKSCDVVFLNSERWWFGYDLKQAARSYITPTITLHFRGIDCFNSGL